MTPRLQSLERLLLLLFSSFSTIRAGQRWISIFLWIIDEYCRLLSVILIILELLIRSIYSSLYLWHTEDYKSSVSELISCLWLYRKAPTTPGLLLPRQPKQPDNGYPDMQTLITANLWEIVLHNNSINGHAQRSAHKLVRGPHSRRTDNNFWYQSGPGLIISFSRGYWKQAHRVVTVVSGYSGRPATNAVELP